MDEKARLKLGLFRFSLIAPLMNGSLDDSVKDYLETICAKTYDVPGLGQREFCPRTLLHWRAMYLSYGLEGLMSKRRKDQGEFRRLRPEARELLTQALRNNPRRTATTLYQDLAEAGLLGHPPCSLSTVQRFLRTVEVPEPQAPERRRFVFARANGCWQSDICVGPSLLAPGSGRKEATYLVAILDDASRLCVHAAFSLRPNYLAFENVLKTALKTRGIPQRLYVDNAKIYRSQQLQVACAHLGIILCHSEPYRPEGRGKIERYFRSVRAQCFSRLTRDDLVSLEALHLRFTQWVEGDYHSRPHSSLDGRSPMQRFLEDQEHLRVLPPERIDEAFLHEFERRVAGDATISVNRSIFEVPQTFMGQRVRVRLRPDDPNHAWIEEPSGNLIPIRPVRPVDNSQIPRRKREDHIDYQKLFKEVR